MDIGLVNLGLVLVCARVLCWHRSCLWYILTTLAICANQRVVYTLYCMLMTAHRPTVAYCSRLYPMIMTCIAVLSTSEVAGECLPADCLGEQWQCIHYRWVFTCWLSRWTVTMYTLQVSVYLLTVSVNSDNVYITGECLPADCLGEQWQRIHYRWAFTCWLSWWTVTMYTLQASAYLLIVLVNSDNVYITGERLPADCLGEQWQCIHSGLAGITDQEGTFAAILT